MKRLIAIFAIAAFAAAIPAGGAAGPSAGAR